MSTPGRLTAIPPETVLSFRLQAAGDDLDGKQPACISTRDASRLRFAFGAARPPAHEQAVRRLPAYPYYPYAYPYAYGYPYGYYPQPFFGFGYYGGWGRYGASGGSSFAATFLI